MVQQSKRAIGGATSATNPHPWGKPPRGGSGQAVLPLPDPPRDLPTVAQPVGPEYWVDAIRDALGQSSSDALRLSEDALHAWPTEPDILLLAALTALAGNLPDRALRLLKRYGKRYVTGNRAILLTGLAQAQSGQFARAWATLVDAGLQEDRMAAAYFVGDRRMSGWLFDRLRVIRRERLRTNAAPTPPPRERSDARPGIRGTTPQSRFAAAAGAGLRAARDSARSSAPVPTKARAAVPAV